MKKLFFAVCFLHTMHIALGQAPAGYYTAANGLTGAALKTKLSQIITTGHNTSKSYNQLYTGYVTTDADKYYENDNTVLDMYSEKPNGPDAYQYQHNVRTCGTYNGEGDCYNREHTVPQSLFGSNAPMKNDIQFVIPTDGWVNGKRSNYPYGKVNNPNWTSSNGSKLGYNASGSGYYGLAFEPIDEFKGDIARMVLYFVTRYQSQLPNFSSGDILDASTFKGLKQWQVDLFLQWHNQDPVSQREKDRNNAAFAYQGNRNPYIDRPEWVNCIWGTANCSSTAIYDLATSANIDVYPNPAQHTAVLDWSRLGKNVVENLDILSIDGRIVWQKARPQNEKETIDLQNMPSGIYIIKVKTQQGLGVQKFEIRH